MSEKILRGLNLEGTVRVFTKSKEVTLKSKKKATITDVWTNMSYKVGENEYLQAALKLTFGRDADIPTHNTDIKVKGFLTVSGNPGYERLAMFVQEWEEVTPAPEAKEEEPEEQDLAERLKSMTLPQLRTEAEDYGIDTTNMKKADIIKEILTLEELPF